MKKILSTLALLAVLAGALWQGRAALLPQAAPERDGYLLLAISWTPSWCARTGDAREAARCAPGSGAGWLVHGLWPQFDTGDWPEFCDTPHPPPSRSQTAAMIDIMGSDGLALHQWRKHGTCSGLSASAYFEQTRAAFTRLHLPDALRPGAGPLRRSPDALLADLRAANPGLGEDMAILTCRDGMAQEIRLCLSHDLTPRACDVALLARHCRARSVTLPARP